MSDSVWSKLASWRVLSTFFLGVSSGLPLLLIGSTLKVWLTEEKVDLAKIGLFAQVGYPYIFKFIWSPLMDRYTPPFLDHRRGWILISQIGLVIVVSVFAFLSPATELGVVAATAMVIAFLGATQDIAIDAYRREILKDEELGLGSSLAINGYRVGMLIAGAGALFIADSGTWKTAYLSMAGVIGLCTVFTLLAPRTPALLEKREISLADSFIAPLKDYFLRPHAIMILVFILLYKIGDQMASDMFSPFYIFMEYTKTEIAAVSKLFGFWATIVGGLLGGVVLLKIGIYRGLWFFGILQALSTAAFCLLAQSGKSIPLLASVIAFENVASGMGSAAYVAFMASLTNIRFTATQYALLTSLMGVPRVVLGSTSGFIAKELGWTNYFLFCALIAIPGLLMLKWVIPMVTFSKQSPPSKS